MTSSPLKLRAKCPQFRVLIIGAANAGKTTILKRVCESKDGPLTLDKAGKKLVPTELRGDHDIEQELVFKSNPNFIFHDSCGFEGGDLELKRVMKFLRDRAAKRELKKQLHAIWYCIPLDSSRPKLFAEEQFFGHCGTGNGNAAQLTLGHVSVLTISFQVPVVVIFTKFDAFVTKVEADYDYEDDETVTEDMVLKVLDEKYRRPVYQMQNKPKGDVYLQEMHKEDAKCSKLMETTYESIDDEALKLLFVSVQRNNLKLCVRRACNYAV